MTDLLKEPCNPVPTTKPGTKATALAGTVITKKTKPAPRVTEASLIRELEKRGIGRPSTYAAIIDTISSRGYVITEKRVLVPTPLGEKIVSGLCGHFSFMSTNSPATWSNPLMILRKERQNTAPS